MHDRPLGSVLQAKQKEADSGKNHDEMRAFCEDWVKTQRDAGKQAVRADIEGEGFTEPGRIIYKDDPRRRLGVTFEHEMHLPASFTAARRRPDALPLAHQDGIHRA